MFRGALRLARCLPEDAQCARVDAVVLADAVKVVDRRDVPSEPGHMRYDPPERVVLVTRVPSSRFKRINVLWRESARDSTENVLHLPSRNRLEYLQSLARIEVQEHVEETVASVSVEIEDGVLNLGRVQVARHVVCAVDGQASGVGEGKGGTDVLAFALSRRIVESLFIEWLVLHSSEHSGSGTEALSYLLLVHWQQLRGGQFGLTP